MNNRIVFPYNWVGHIPFAFYLIEKTKPKMIVELGTHSGNSFIAFCEACRIYNSDAKLYAIDLWKGDNHAGFYDENIFEDLKKYVDENYSDNVKLIRKDFNRAVFDFEDGSIDCLHIDGLHTYDAVKNDFETWLPKLKSNAVVLFHDTEVYRKDFGVHRYWKELIKTYKLNFNFRHSNGLGIIILKENFENNFISELRNSSWLSSFFEDYGNKLIEFNSLKDSYNKIKLNYETSISFRFRIILRKIKNKVLNK
ncbi:class I SAM-dependent methyltransferase [Echinicola marina]|uniref:class I SAM-dependent methyltransferase n=1 Tax=Echinicola marina TaxID=2859768 RepID=UPI001CF63F59|nr:class I SAM-dependent methyltransferase [Echinicola marina]UCS91987.1 class I SAM-dependent methyltransferase [Echinicola marina]